MKNLKILGNDIFILEIASWTLSSKNFPQPNHLLLRNCKVTFLSARTVAKISKNIPFENVKDNFSLVPNLLAAVVVKKSVAVWNRNS